MIAQNNRKTRWYVPNRTRGPKREFHVSRSARDTYSFAKETFSLAGHVLFADVKSAREFAMRINTVRRAILHPERSVRAGDVYAMGLIDEIFHYLIGEYLTQYGREQLAELEKQLVDTIGADALERMLRTFAERFPTVDTYRGQTTPDETLSRTIDGISGRHIALEEILVMWVGNRNPAYAPLIELFDEELLAIDTSYREAMKTVQDFFATSPGFGPDDQTLIEMLRAPAIAHPDDLHAQLEYIRTRWASILGSFLDRILRSLDVISEETKGRFFGPGETRVLEYSSAVSDEDYARFSPDREWMPRAVIIAKSTLVWLDQLSKQYQREIRTLDAIPDGELDELARQGFTGLWLIGLWQRSSASRRIKNLCGNPEAEASAYSLYDYEIADEIGGWAALDTLRRRLWARGIRVASDMVPNHTGIDSRWIHEHPEWYISLPHPPFPGYTFNGENLSTNPSVGIYLEDHYYDRSDAAVVFKHVDFNTGTARYIYHGNDGTSMPWNDTAQLDYLNPQVREAVIQLILRVARNFPIIRFDAAMTLAKKHIQRLWYPAPGQGGDIPSRSEYGLPQSDFDAAIPEEFWREVVDRVAEEVPDTLLLAEAFWMMESYFVRNLGMHRVYNSAFMNMLKNEENEKYRQTVKNTLLYDPEVLKRFVNFMNNPDEETAVAQFGTGDKYFGVATLMVTMPGLPMFGHGQIEGFAEKYGMEYRRAYWDETPDQELIARHRRELFPLMHRRYLFADAANFRMFDVYNSDGHVLTNVYAYSNKHGDERAFVLYNNSYESAAGWVHTSAPYVVNAETDRQERREQLAATFDLTPSWHHYVIFQEQRSGLWFIRSSGEIAERGLFVSLNGYESQVFLNIHEVQDNEYSHYARLADHLGGSGTPDLNRSLKHLLLQPLHDAFGVVANSGTLRTLFDSLIDDRIPVDWERLAEQYRGFLGIASQFCDQTTRIEDATELFKHTGQALGRLSQLAGHAPTEVSVLIGTHMNVERDNASVFLALTLLLPLDVFVHGEEELTPRAVGFQALDQAAEWMLVEMLRPILAQIQPSGSLPNHWEQLVHVTLAHHNWWHYVAGESPDRAAMLAMEILTADSNVEDFLQIHVHNGVTWFNREAFSRFIDWLIVLGAWHEITASVAAGKKISWKKLADETRNMSEIYRRWKEAEERSGYRVDRFMELLEHPAAGTVPTPTSSTGKKKTGSKPVSGDTKGAGKTGTGTKPSCTIASRISKAA
ncbi:MAG: alpha-amylase family glycosyl hydrolase, partial [Alkalispirochaeta sp.]